MERMNVNTIERLSKDEMAKLAGLGYTEAAGSDEGWRLDDLLSYLPGALKVDGTDYHMYIDYSYAGGWTVGYVDAVDDQGPVSTVTNKSLLKAVYLYLLWCNLNGLI